MNNTETKPTSEPLPKQHMLIIAIAQSLLLFTLHKCTDLELLTTRSLAHFGLMTLFISLPTLYLLTIQHDNRKRLLTLLGGFGIVLALLAWYTHSQTQPEQHIKHITALVSIFVLTIGIACFKAILYIQELSNKRAIQYPNLFANSWRNSFVLALTGVLVGLFWLLLILWAELFKLINISFFDTLFEQDWFIFPILGLIYGIGIILFRELNHIIDTITRLLQQGFRLLLPISLFIAVTFLFTLLFTGLDVLWQTGHGSALILTLSIIILFSVNAVYQDGEGQAPYPLLLHRCLYIALLTLPILTAISAYGIALRVEQHSWSINRLYAALIYLFVILFSIGYCVSILTKRDQWTTGFARVNVSMGIVIMVALLLINSPWLDFRKITLQSQLSRAEDSIISWQDLDYYYFKHELARPGYLAGEKIKAQLSQDVELSTLINQPEPAYRRRQHEIDSINFDHLFNTLKFRPHDFTLPKDLKQYLQGQRYRDLFYSYTRQDHDSKFLMVKKDLGDTVEAEYVLVRYQHNTLKNIIYFYRDDNQQWQMNSTRTIRIIEDLEAQLLTGKLSRIVPKIDYLQIGEIDLQTDSPLP